MTRSFPPEDLLCGDRRSCPVPVEDVRNLAAGGGLPTTRLLPGRSWLRVYDARDGYAHPNPGYGDARFSPVDDARTGARVPTLYLAETLAAALLETVLHDVTTAGRVISEADLHGRLHAHVVPPGPLTVADFRDEALRAMGLPRGGIASSSAEHYGCTRCVAKAVHSSPQDVAGILWHSRRAELTGQGPLEAAVLFADRVPMGRERWGLHRDRIASGSLLEGTGRLLLDELAEELEVAVLTRGDVG